MPSQPSISRFFKSSPKNGPPTPNKRSASQRSNNIEVISLDDDDNLDDDDLLEFSTTATMKSIAEENDVFTKAPRASRTTQPSEPPAINNSLQQSKERAQRFTFDKDAPPSQSTPEQQALREQYKQKLTQQIFTETTAATGQDEAGTDEEVEDSAPPPPKRQKKTPKPKLTPLDEQVKQLKLQNMDKVLAIQVGYKYKFFCEDAVKVHKILNIMLVPGKLNIVNETPADQMYNKLAYCSIPEQRLHIHLQRLLDRGLKVGVADQVENSIIKSVENNNKSSLFKRQVTDVFTKATYIEYTEKGHGAKDDRSLDSLIAIIESPYNDSTVKISIVCIQPLTGEITYDDFDDDFLRNELETRLLHLEPIEILHFENNLSSPTSKVLESFTRQHSTHIRITTYPELKRSFYETFLNQYVSEDDVLFDFISSQTKEFQICSSLLIEYLTEFQLDSAFKVAGNYSNFSEANHMALNANTLQNLEVFQNSTTFEEYGSLLWLLNHTRSKFGFRLLRKWISKPLVHRESIERRLDAVENIQSNFHHFLESLAGELKSCPDLEKMLSRIHYGKVKRKELYIFLKKLENISRLVIKFGKFEILNNLNSPLLKELMEKLIRLSLDVNVSQYVTMINSQHAMDDRTEDYILKYFHLQNLTINQDEIVTENEEIDKIKSLLNVELQKIRDFLKRPSLDFTEKNREPYLIEVRNAIIKIIPKDWTKLSSTKLVSRFRSPEVAALNTQLKYHNELYLNACDAVFKKFVKHIDAHYTELNDVIKCLSQYDCLLSLSAVSAVGNMTRPSFVDSKFVRVQEGRNPIIEQLSNYVANDISMDSKAQCMIITGPNMGGKSSYVKQVALLVIMAQIGCFVPAKSATLGIFHSILTRMGAQDDLIKGESTFFTEMSQMLQVLKNLNQQRGNSLVILDEIGRGTGTVDGISLASSILEYVVQENNNALVLFITHFPSVCKLEKSYPGIIKNYHMGYMEHKINGDDWPKVTFLYNLVEGVAQNSYGLNVAKLAFIDENIIKEAFKISKDRQRQVEQSHRIVNTVKLLQGVSKAVTKGDTNLKDIQKLVELCDDHVINETCEVHNSK